MEQKGRRLRVVVADDNKDMVTTLAFILRDEGYDVRPAYNGKEALAAVQGFEPDAVILDIGMPELNGWQVARAIRELPTGARPLLIAISGEFVKGEDKASTQRAGFDHFFPKPCDTRLLVGLLAKLRPQDGHAR